MKINHVMSSNVSSGIFNDIVGYFFKFKPNGVDIIVTEKPIDDADVYHYHRPHLEKKLKSPSICTVHHDLTETDPWLDFDSKFERIYTESDLIICLNSNQVSYLSDRKIDHTVLLPHGYNDEVFFGLEQSFSVRNEKIHLGIISKRYGRKVKGEEYFYELCKRLDKTKFAFILVGAGRSEDAEFARKLGFEVIVHEYLPYNVFASLYKKIDVLLMLSLYEGGPANIPEAIASGTPIIGNNVGMTSDYIQHGVNGYFLTADIDKDIHIFEELEDNLESIKISSKNLRKTAMTWQNNIHQHVKIYRELMEKVGG